MDQILQKFRDKFIEEAQRILDSLEQNLLDIETNPQGKEAKESAFRAMHTLKGTSSMYGFEFISDFTHHLETIWESIRNEKMQFNEVIFELTFASIDHIRKLLDDENLEIQDNKIAHHTLLEKVKKLSSTSEPSNKPHQEISTKTDDGVASWHIIIRITEQLFFRGIRISNILAELIALGQYEISKVESLSNATTDVWSVILTTTYTEDDIRDVLQFIEDECSIINLTNDNIFSGQYVDSLLLKQQNQKQSLLSYSENFANEKQDVKTSTDNTTKNQDPAISSKKTTKRISVDASKLDQLMFLVSELITINSQLNTTARYGSVNQMLPHLERMDILSKQFRNNAIEIRLVPLSDTILRFQRLIRDLSLQLGKVVEFKTVGMETTLDKDTIDLLAEPLMHIIRNCLDHGIETPEKRKSNGKAPQGILTLSAYNTGNHVYISISDDGNGVDFAKVKQKAVDLGIYKQSDNLSNKDILDLIFRPGFSTAHCLTSVSGRGVGMDIVKQKITDLRGEVTVTTEAGVGTSFTIKLQQSLSIIDSLLFSVDDIFFTVPISEIEVCNQVYRPELELRKKTATLEYNNHLIPYIDLRSQFNMPASDQLLSKVIIVKNEVQEVALIADEIIGEHQAVLKPLGKLYQNQKYISSASQIGDGNMAFMLDTLSLMKHLTSN